MIPGAPGWAESVIPTDSFSAGGSGPSAADSVNLASGGEENDPGPDLVVRNPVGPGAAFARSYRSVLAQRDTALPASLPVGCITMT